MSPARAPRVAVAGGSIGGLNAALWLTEAGCDVHVYERSRETLDSRGAGIVVQPDTVRYLEMHGTPVEAMSTSTSGRAYLSPDGSVLTRVPGSQRFTSWNTLYRRLLHHLDPSRYHLGSPVASVERDSKAARLVLADGTAVEADLVVAADGARSTIRRSLLPEVAPRYAGYVAWRGLEPEHALSPAALAVLATRSCSPSSTAATRSATRSRDRAESSSRGGGS